MPASRMCETCAHFCGLALECRVDKPQPAVIGVNENTKQPITFGYFPPTRKDKWCGRHETEAEYALRKTTGGTVQ